MTRVFVIIVALAQFGVLAFMAGQREWVARSGRTIYLRTAPIDPNDPMRGDYVKLNYEIADVPRALCKGQVASWCGHNPYDRSQPGYRDRRVYAELKLDRDGLAQLVSLSDTPPASGIYLRGRVELPNWNSDGIRVRYGIEALFMEEGHAQAFEAAQRGEQAGVPLDMEVAISANGLAVLKGYHWEPLGLVLTVDRPAPIPPPVRTSKTTIQPPIPPPPRPGVMGATLELKNHSDHPVAILPHSFRLVGNQQRGPSHYRWIGNDAAPPKPTAEDVVVLQPGESYRTHLDFSSPEWFVSDTAKPAEAPVAIGTMANAWDASFRIEYAPPSAEDCAGLPNADLIRHNSVLSRAFGTGAVD